jgi:hypothetical protein
MTENSLKMRCLFKIGVQGPTIGALFIGGAVSTRVAGDTLFLRTVHLFTYHAPLTLSDAHPGTALPASRVVG